MKKFNFFRVLVVMLLVALAVPSVALAADPVPGTLTPDADFDGFTLLGVEAQEDQLIYYYMPADGPAYDGFDYRRGISVAVCTDPAVTLEQVCGQMGLTVGPDGFALDAEHDQLLFEQDGHTCSLQMPEGTDPETMKEFCRITTIPLN